MPGDLVIVHENYLSRGNSASICTKNIVELSATPVFGGNLNGRHRGSTLSSQILCSKTQTLGTCEGWKCTPPRVTGRLLLAGNVEKYEVRAACCVMCESHLQLEVEIGNFDATAEITGEETWNHMTPGC